MTSDPPRSAAGVIPVRPRGDGWETLMLLRPAASAFAGDFYVWPGGKIDEVDFQVSHLISGGITGGAHLDDERAIIAAAVREAYEEVGLQLFDREVPGLSQYEEAAQFWRRLQDQQCQLVADRFRFVLSWLTPKHVPMRFLAHFVMTEVPSDFEVRLHEREVVDARWFSAAEAIDAFATGDIKLMYPTYQTLRALAKADSIGDLERLLSHAPTEIIEPSMDVASDGALRVKMSPETEAFFDADVPLPEKKP